jgi:trehalose 6-phosphate phosphatase
VPAGVIALVRLALETLAEAPSALITDIDGTISPIVARPEDASVSPGVRRSLEALAKRLALVAVVSGRDEATARRMVGAAGITYVGNYGLQDANLSPTILAAAEAEARAALAASPCVQVESKGVSFAAHYRNCPDTDDARVRVLDTLAPIAKRHGGRVVEGKMVAEMVPAALPDKASAVLRLSRERVIRGVVYLGDDVGDIPVFKAIRERRQQEGLAGLTIAIIDRETNPEVRATADATLSSVAEVEAFLASLAGNQE